MVSQQWYYPYGAPRAGGGLPTNRTYTGQIADEGVGSLMFYNARFYSPLLGRFVSADTLVPEPGNPQALNRYSYSLSNPLKYTDPSGHSVDCAFGEPNCAAGKIVPYSARRPTIPSKPMTKPPKSDLATQQTLIALADKFGRTPTYGEIFVMTVASEGFASRNETARWADGTTHTLGEFLLEGTTRTMYRNGKPLNGAQLVNHLGIDEPWSGRTNQDPADPKLAQARADKLYAYWQYYKDDPTMEQWVEKFDNPGDWSQGWEANEPWNWFNRSSDRTLGSANEQVLWTGTVNGQPFTMYTFCQGNPCK